MGYYKVNFDSLDAMYQSTSDQATSWNERLETLSGKITALSESDNMSGATADAIRSYLSSVHGTIIRALGQLVSLHTNNLLLYKTEYQSVIDTDLHAVIDTAEVDDIQELLEKKKSLAVGVDESVAYILGQISDIFSIGYRDVSSVSKAHTNTIAFLNNLCDSIEQLERKHIASDFSNTQELISSLTLFINERLNTKRSFSDYINTDFSSSTNFLALQHAGLALLTELHYKSESIEAANQLETTRLENLKDDRSGFAKFLNNELKVSDSVLDGSKSTEGDVLGFTSAGTVSGSILYGEAGIKNKMSWKYKDDDGNWDFKSFGVSTEAKATGALAKGTAEGNIGYLHGKAEGSAFTGAVSGEVKATLWDDGKFNPSLSVGAKAEGSVLQGKAEAGFGTDQYGIYAKADGDVLHAEAEANAGVGYIKTDKDGNAQYGASAKASAMASVAQGKVKGGITVLGIDIDVGLKGYAVAAGVEVGGSVTTSGVKANFSGALGLGAGLDISVDWSDAKWIGDAADAVGDFASDVGSAIGDGFDYIGDVFDWW